MTVKEKERIYQALEAVKDPEIPTVSVVEMGMVHQVTQEDGGVTVEMLPTFVGCPALGLMEQEIKKQLAEVDGVEQVRVRFVYDPPWTSDRITPEGRSKLKSCGIAPPPVPGDDPSATIHCPYCESPYTNLENLFGPAACRSILYCKSCKNPFEAFKVI